MTEEKKKEHDLKWELRQLRLRLEDDEMHINAIKDDITNAKKAVNDLILVHEVMLQILDRLVDDVKALKEDKNANN